MENGRGDLTKAYMTGFVGLLMLILATAVVANWRLRIKISRDNRLVAAVLAYVVLLRSAMFTLAGTEFNVRYALPQYEIGVVVLWVFLILAHRQTSGAQGRGFHLTRSSE
jgi:hypothetical protein